MKDNHIFNYTKITDYIYIGSDLCNGDVCSIHGNEFKKLGVCTEINLSAEKKETPPDSIDAYIWLPVIDMTAPTQDQLRIGSAIINENVENGNTIYVHCKNGHGRSPTLVAAYLIRYKNLEVDEAISFIKSKRSEIHPNDEQICALEEYKLNISNSR